MFFFPIYFKGMGNVTSDKYDNDDDDGEVISW